jgi:ComF family protein
MPLSRERLRQRGYNQSLLLAKKLGFAGLQARLCKNLLVRRLDTQPQSNLSRADRARNVQHAFEVPPEQTVHVRGQQVVLIDDVMTSGATLYAAALALRLAGAAQVSALVFARTRHGID